jgi:anthranilate phosphoribosyltransferase
MVVHSRDGLDEISVSAPTHVCEIRDGQIRAFDLTPEGIGVRTHRIEEIAGGDSRENARIARAILAGEDGARADIVVANAGAALYVAGISPTIRDGVSLAREAIKSGEATRKLDSLIAASREVQ